MIWWTWGLIGWSLVASAAVIWLAALCSLRRRRPAARQVAPASPPAPAPAPAPAESAAPQRSTQPLDHLRPALAAVRAEAGGDERSRALERLLEGARAGHYTLPVPILRATQGHRRLFGLEVPAPRPFVRTDAAARLVTEATQGEALDPVALTARVHRSRADLLVFTEALQVVAMAVEIGQHDAAAVAGEMSRRIIEEHLRPAHREVLREARRVAARLAPYTERFEVDTTRIVTARRRVRSACAALPALVRRHRSIRDAWDAVNLLDGQRPRHDSRDLFAFFEEPLVLVPPGPTYDRTPLPPLPEDDAARLLWLASARASRARPWLPTVQDQDAAWSSCFEAPAGARRHDGYRLEENVASARRERDVKAVR